MSNFHIIVTSSGRADRLITPKSLSPWLREITTFIVPYEQYDAYAQALDEYGINVASPPVGIDLMSPKRQWAIEYAENMDFICILDDDLDFFVRTPEMKLVKALPEQVDEMFIAMHDALDSGIQFTGISSRFGNNQVAEDYKDIGRVSRCWAFNRKTYMKLGIRIDPFPEYCIDDFHIILSFLEAGHANRVFYKYSQDDKGSNTAGGCSVYRDFDVQRRSAEWLASKHPGFVDVVEKRTKHSWPGMKKGADGSNVRHDVRIHWQKAYQRGKSGGGMAAFLKSRQS